MARPVRQSQAFYYSISIFGPQSEFIYTIGTIFEIFVPFFAQNASFGPIFEKLVEHFVMVEYELIFSVETRDHSWPKTKLR